MKKGTPDEEQKCLKTIWRRGSSSLLRANTNEASKHLITPFFFANCYEASSNLTAAAK